MYRLKNGIKLRPLISQGIEKIHMRANINAAEDFYALWVIFTTPPRDIIKKPAGCNEGTGRLQIKNDSTRFPLILPGK